MERSADVEISGKGGKRSRLIFKYIGTKFVIWCICKIYHMMVLWLYDMLWHNVIRYGNMTWLHYDTSPLPQQQHCKRFQSGRPWLRSILLYSINISYNEYNILYIMIYIIYAKKLIEVDKTRNLAASMEFKFEFLFFIHKKPIHWRQKKSYCQTDKLPYNSLEFNERKRPLQLLKSTPVKFQIFTLWFFSLIYARKRNRVMTTIA